VHSDLGCEEREVDERVKSFWKEKEKKKKRGGKRESEGAGREVDAFSVSL